ncbi:Ubiquitin-like domain-containing protein [Meloidogyne graminicola]|uniref:Ubiquitin-like domain-containing protein n=1 Tax=Meloidogyne graminicola TaxID=189291 RepID=A0A8S9ZBT8_9BILA|nr:Ubiquitin-like domain-containing protein [Meloidogyne graminicola]
MQVIIKDMDNKKFFLNNVKESDKISVIKAMIELNRGITCKDSYRLYYQGYNLDDDRTIADYRIENHSVINLVLRFTGC